MDSEKFKMRILNKSDIDEAVKIIHENLRTVNSKVYPQEVINFMCDFYSVDEFVNQLGDFFSLFVVEYLKETDELKKGQIVGLGGWQVDPDNHNQGIVRTMFVNPNFHGHGIGGYLLQKIEEDAQNHVKNLFLEASLNAEKFYGKFGYKLIKTHDHGKFGIIKMMEKQM